MLGTIKRNFKHLNIRSVLFSSVQIMVRWSHLDHKLCGIPITKVKQEAVEKVHKRATKILPELKDIILCNCERLRACNKGRRIRGDMIETYNTR